MICNKNIVAFLITPITSSARSAGITLYLQEPLQQNKKYAVDPRKFRNWEGLWSYLNTLNKKTFRSTR